MSDTDCRRLSRSTHGIAVFARKLQTAIRLPWLEKLWILFLMPVSGIARAALLVIPFRYLSRCFGMHHQNIPLSVIVPQQQLQMAWRIGRVCELVSRYTPWQSMCLVQAIMAKTLLSLYRIPCVLYFGVAKTPSDPPSGDDDKALKAHAWLMVGPWIITGRGNQQAFTVVSTFVSRSVFNVY